MVGILCQLHVCLMCLSILIKIILQILAPRVFLLSKVQQVILPENCCEIPLSCCNDENGNIEIGVCLSGASDDYNKRF